MILFRLNRLVACSLVDGIVGVDHGDGVLEHLDDSVVAQLSGSDVLVQLGGQHREAVQVFAIGDEQSPAVVALAALFDALRAEYLQDGLPWLVFREHPLEE